MFIQLSPELRKQLEKAVNAAKSQARLVSRAKVILLFADNYPPSEIAKRLKVSYPMIRKWVKRFTNNPNMKSLDDAKRSGRPHVIPVTVKCEVMKFACSDVRSISSDYGNIWTIKSLKTCVEMHSGVSLSKSEISRILNSRHLKPHKVKMWLHSPDPRFKEKVSEISALYLNPPKNAVILCIDEKTGMQALERQRSMASNGLIRIDPEYKRHGTQTLIAAFNPKTGHVFGRCGQTRKTEDIHAFMEDIAALYPDQEVYIIWDNLNIHTSYRWFEFNRKHGQRFHFVYTPVHASWINQIEIWFGILQRKVLKNGSFKSEEELRESVLKFISRWNEEKHPFNWQFRGYIEKKAA